MQRRAKGLKCAVGDKRFTVVRVGKGTYDTHAGRSFQDAMDMALPDRGDTVEVYVTCAPDAGAARLLHHRQAVLTKRFKFRGGR
jgi:hypothetical protein